MCGKKNRFVGLVQVHGQVHPAHVPSSGRMRDCSFLEILFT
nr:hypothetical protein [Desulforamulus aquiferis]